MNPIATKRPGVYSQYAVTSLYARPVSERAAALAGVFPEVEGVTRLSRYSEAAALLEGWALAACSLLFGRGGGRGLPLAGSYRYSRGVRRRLCRLGAGGRGGLHPLR